jgi:hypothetical protein
MHMHMCTHVHVTKRMHVILSERQHAFLRDESRRTGLPMGELLRRALDTTYRPHQRPTVNGFELSLGMWKRPDAAVVGRRRLR